MDVNFLEIKRLFNDNEELSKFKEYIVNELREEYAAKVLNAPFENLPESMINVFRGCVYNIDEIFDFDKLHQAASNLILEDKIGLSDNIEKSDPIVQ